jgi:hypothetical protein
MQSALLTQIPQPILTILPIHPSAQTTPSNPGYSLSSFDKTHRCTTSHRSQKTRSRLTRGLILATAQPRHGNDLLHRLTSNPVSGRCSGIGTHNLFLQKALLVSNGVMHAVLSRGAYDTALESEGQGCCSVSELDRAAGVGVVIGHGTEESGGLEKWSKMVRKGCFFDSR